MLFAEEDGRVLAYAYAHRAQERAAYGWNAELSVYVSRDAGLTWNVLGSGLPTSYVWDIAIHPRDNAMVIATNGRGMWLIDDLAPVQNAAK